MKRGNASGLKHAKRNGRIVFCFFEGVKNFFSSPVECFLRFFSFHGIVKNGAYVMLIKFLNGVFTFFHRFATTEMFKDRAPDNWFYGKVQSKTNFGKTRSHR